MVVVLAFNNVSDTIECIESIQSLCYPNVRCLVVDNGSTDGTSQILEHRFPSITLVRTMVNRGVPTGFNLGIRSALKAGASFVFLINNDTSVAPDLVSVLVDHAESHANAAIVMPKILYYDHRDTVWSAGARRRRFPPSIVFIGLGRPDDEFTEVKTIEYAPSCGLLVRRSVFERIGLFDEGYRFYYDDWDFSLRVRDAGYQIDFVPMARMWHKVSRTIRKRRDEFWRTWGESAARFYRRHGHPVVLSLPIHLGYIVAREVVQGNASSVPYFVVGLLRGLTSPLRPYPTVSGNDNR